MGDTYTLMDIQSFLQFDPKTRMLTCQGQWELHHLREIQHELSLLSLADVGDITVNGSGIQAMDTAGAWLLSSWLHKKSLSPSFQQFSDHYQRLITIVEKESLKDHHIPEKEKLDFLARLGQFTIEQAGEFKQFLQFTGQLAFDVLRVFANPGRVRWKALSLTIYQTGVQALPIIALLSFMIGVVIAYQMGLQLRNYGANIFIVDLLGFSILREFGPLITAIMVAGRTGSAFAAQLGTMKVNEEIDALDTMGITPAELLILPRMAGLVIALPLLSMWADIFGILGGMLMAQNMLDVSWQSFLKTFQHRVPLSAFIIGLGKTPVFALLISSIGCFQGMQVQGSADSVGQKTTRSVVLAIFFIIVTDAIFSIIFSKLKL